MVTSCNQTKQYAPYQILYIKFYTLHSIPNFIHRILYTASGVQRVLLIHTWFGCCGDWMPWAKKLK